MHKNYPNPDISAKGIQAHVSSSTDFTGIAPAAHHDQEFPEQYDDLSKGQKQSYPFLQAHQSNDMKQKLKRDQL